MPNVFRRPRPQPVATPPDPYKTGIATAETLPDATRVLSDLLARPNLEGVLEGALAYAAQLLGGSVSGYAVIRRGQDRISAVYQYPKTLIGTALSGPWSAMRTRVLADGTREVFETNSPEIQEMLHNSGMHEVTLSLVVPLSDRGRHYGALVLDRNSQEGISPSAQEAITKWAAAVTPLVGILESRDEWRNVLEATHLGLGGSGREQRF